MRADAAESASSGGPRSAVSRVAVRPEVAGTWGDAWAEMRLLLRQHRGMLAVGFGLMLVNRLAALVLPASSKYLVDDVLGRERADLLPLLGLAVVVAVTAESATGFGLARVVGTGAQRAITELRTSLMAHLVRLPAGFFEAGPSGTLIARVMTDTEGVRSFLGTGLVQLVGGLLTAVLALGLLFTLNWQLTVIIAVLLAVYVLALTRAFGWLFPAFRRVSERTAQLTARLAETVGGIRVVKSYAAEQAEADMFARDANRLLGEVVRAVTGTSALTAGSTLLTGLVGVMLLVVGGRAVLAGTMTLGDVAMYVFLVGLLTTPLLQLAAYGSEVSRAAAGLSRIRELRSIATEPEEDRERGALPVRSLIGAVELDRVSYAYRSDCRSGSVPGSVHGRLVLHDIDLYAPAGSTTALVGRSGSGKSTICRLLLAFDRPTRGRVLIDGCDLALLRRGDYRSHLGVVLQEGFLFDGSVAENIRYARPQATLAEVRTAGRIAHCEEFAEELPEGYQTVVGERGVKLSGGQRQRVAIARAILADPRILILDEATSHLDAESEALIQDALQALRSGRTTFVIAHRMSTVESADQILVLEAGRMVERGAHHELVSRSRRYRQMYDTQHPNELASPVDRRGGLQTETDADPSLSPLVPAEMTECDGSNRRGDGRVLAIHHETTLPVMRFRDEAILTGDAGERPRCCEFAAHR
ncbi:MAG: ABC transporter ATP-binding protein, partial [Gemmatimonadaceae bacterium]